MPMLIDWHAHHTASEAGERLAALGGRAPRPDPQDSPDFSQRIAEMDGSRLDVQLVSLGAGLNADRLAPGASMEVVRLSNDLVAERIAPYPERLFGSIAISWANVPGSVDELRRMAANGFRAVTMFARPDLVGDPEVEPIWATIDELGLPIFLHGGGAGPRGGGVDLSRLEDGGQGVAVSAHADAAVGEFVVGTIAAGLFDRYPNLQLVIRSSGGGVPLLLSKLWWKHKGPAGEQRYADVLLQHYLVDCASSSPRTMRFLIDTMGEERVVFGSDYCGGLGPLAKALPVIQEQPDPAGVTAMTERNTRRLLKL
jgi:predicted TIM-barrel fold metal-dependent hydrolase